MGTKKVDKLALRRNNFYHNVKEDNKGTLKILNMVHTDTIKRKAGI